MFKGTQDFLKLLWPFIECLILATLIGMNVGTLAAIVVIFIALFVFAILYGSIIRCIGWGICGMTIFIEDFHLVLDSLLGIVFFVVRYVPPKIMKKLAS